ncbi:MAG TPA: hypothetical protein PKX56_08705, partial [Marmoricola sp.]|nr:hypothetical protein [Marmoricola sp.]
MTETGLGIEITRAHELMTARASLPAGTTDRLMGAGQFQAVWTKAAITAGTALQATQAATGTASGTTLRTTG